MVLDTNVLDNSELSNSSEVALDDAEILQDEMFEHYKFLVDKGQTLVRIDKYITDHMEKTSRNRVQMAIDAGYVRVNGNIIKANYKVKPLDVITIVFPYKRHLSEIIPENIPLDVVYEDSYLLIVNKPAGMVVHPGHGHFSGTLINALAFHLGIETRPMKCRYGSVQDNVASQTSKTENSLTSASSGDSNETDERLGILVHRIDKNTSGLLVVAKTEESQLYLAKQFFEHTIERKYVALVWGNIKEDSGTIDGNIGRDPNDRLKFKVFPDGSCGKHAVTHYTVLKRYGYVTLVECRLETGRTHQIRVHMNYIGHPLFNDDRYGGDRILKGTIYTKYKQFIDNCFEIMPRHALHAKTLGFIHPNTKKHIYFDSQLPKDFISLIEKWDKRSTINDELEDDE
jgi:pseudouridine synthase, RluA family